MVGGLCYWLVFLCLTVFLAPGASYLFTWPLLFNLAALAYVFASKHPSVKHLAVLALCALPGVVLFVPIVYLTGIALTLNSLGSLVTLTAAPILLLGTLSPHLMVLFSPNRTHI